MLTLDTPVDVTPLPLATEDADAAPDTVAAAYGWGIDYSKSGILPLKSISLRVRSGDDCATFVDSFDPRTMLCIGDGEYEQGSALATKVARWSRTES